MKKNIIFKISTLILLSVFLISCSKEENVSIKTITHKSGYSVELPEKTKTIISGSPAVTEMLVAMGLSEDLISVDSYSKMVDGVSEDLPEFDIMSPDTEQLIVLKPDIVFITGMSSVDGTDPYKLLREAGIAVVTLDTPTSIEGIKNDILFIGEIVGEKEKSLEIISNMENQLADLKSKIKSDSIKKTVYFEIGFEPTLVTFGKDVFLNELIEDAGLINVTGELESWVSVSEEIIINANPDIIFTNIDYIENPENEILNRNGWDAITAVKNKDVFYIDNSASSLPSQNITKAFEEIINFAYPEI